jgi:hypothetical protein
VSQGIKAEGTTLAFGWRDYKNSLKETENEELLDLYFYRFLGYGVVKMISWSSITPNQVTYLGMVCGLVSASFFYTGELIAAAVMLLMANVMDCADGQLARLKKNGTYLGGVVDGFFDYIVGATTIIAMGGYLCRMHEPLLIIPFMLAAGLSRAFQNIMVDQRRHFFTKSSKFDADAFSEDEISLRLHLQQAKEQRKGLLEKTILRCGITYITLQRLGIRTTRVTFSDFKAFNAFPDQRALLLRGWSFLGSTTHITLVIVTAMMDRVELYFWITLIAGNLFLITLVLVETILVHRLGRIPVEVK